MSDFTYGKFRVSTDYLTGDRIVYFGDSEVGARLSGTDFMQLMGALAHSADSWERRHLPPPPSPWPTEPLIPSTDLRRAELL